MKNRELMTKILEAWYVVDSILFNDHAKYVIKEGSKFREYISLKGAMLSSLYEYYSHIKYQPIYEDGVLPTDIKVLVENARKTAIYSKKVASKMLQKENIKTALKQKIIREAEENNAKDVNSFSEQVIQEKFTQLTLDNILVGIPVLDSQDQDKCDDMKGQILEDSYKMMRNNLMDLAKTCMTITKS